MQGGEGSVRIQCGTNAFRTASHLAVKLNKVAGAVKLSPPRQPFAKERAAELLFDIHMDRKDAMGYINIDLGQTVSKPLELGGVEGIDATGHSQLCESHQKRSDRGAGISWWQSIQSIQLGAMCNISIVPYICWPPLWC